MGLSREEEEENKSFIFDRNMQCFGFVSFTCLYAKQVETKTLAIETTLNLSVQSELFV
jgi:hypothetical protein